MATRGRAGQYLEEGGAEGGGVRAEEDKRHRYGYGYRCGYRSRYTNTDMEDNKDHYR